MPRDLLFPSKEDENNKHKLKRLIQSPNSYFIDIKCKGCITISTVFSHAQSVVKCSGCAQDLTIPTGGKCTITEGNQFRRKKD